MGKEQKIIVKIKNCFESVFSTPPKKRWSQSNLLPDMPNLGSSNSAANKDMMSKIWTNGDSIIRLTRKHCGKSYEQFLLFPQCFPKLSVVDALK